MLAGLESPDLRNRLVAQRSNAHRPRARPTARLPTGSTSTSKATGRRFSLAPGETNPQEAHEEGGLFVSVLTTDAMAVATSDRLWLRAMLDFEVALARAEARAGVIPPEAAEAIERCCRSDQDFDPVALGRAGRLSGNPAVALVGALRERLPEQTARWAHFGATSQDMVDTALMIVLRQALRLVLGDLGRAKDAAAGLAERYRSTPMAARTLLQQALPTTFGRKAAGWLVALTEVTEGLNHVYFTIAWRSSSVGRRGRSPRSGSRRFGWLTRWLRSSTFAPRCSPGTPTAPALSKRRAPWPCRLVLRRRSRSTSRC